jgi:hypothetical protein
MGANGITKVPQYDKTKNLMRLSLKKQRVIFLIQRASFAIDNLISKQQAQ